MRGQPRVVLLDLKLREVNGMSQAAAGFAGHLVQPAEPAEVHAKLTQVLSSSAQGA